MSGSVLNRLVWKEYRLLRGFWWAMLIAALLGQLCALWAAERPSEAHWIFLIGIGLTACYALGCGATAFAGERESGTYALQRILPVTPPELLLGKLLYAALSTLALGLAAWLIAMLLVYLRRATGDGTYITDSYAEIGVLGAFKSIELLVWGVFFSLLLTKPLRAIAFAALATAAVSYPLSWLMSDIPEHARTALYFPSFLGDSATLIPRAVIVMLVLGCDIYLVTRWFDEPTASGAERSGRETQRKELSRRLAERLQTNPQRQRLLWQSLVRSRWMLGACVLTYLSLIVANYTLWDSVEPTALFGMLVPVAGLMGVFVFADDQRRHRYRFFAEQGISSRQVWWSRQFFWLGILVGILFAVTVTGIAVGGGKPFGWIGWSYVGMFCTFTLLAIALNRRCAPWLWIAMGIVVLILLALTTYEIHLHGTKTNFWKTIGQVWNLWTITILVFAVGQLSSQWIRSTIMAGAVTLIAATLLVAWSRVAFDFHVNVWGAVVPIPIALWFASWATADDWLKDRTGHGLRKVLLLAIPALGILAFVATFRALQIPAVTPTFNVTGLSDAERKEGEETAAMYTDLALRFGGNPKAYDWDSRDWKYPSDAFPIHITPETRRWLDEHADDIQRAVSLSRRQTMVGLERPYFHGMWPVWETVTLAARRQQHNGNLDRALQYYLAALRIGRHGAESESNRRTHFIGEMHVLHYLRYWATEPGQTPERIRRALDGLEQIWAPPLDPEIGIAKNYQESMKILSDVTAGKPIASSLQLNRYGPYSLSFFRWSYRIMPWELARAKRLAAFSTQLTQDSLRRWRTSLRDHEPPKFEDWDTWREKDTWQATMPTLGSNWSHAFRIGVYLAHTEAIRRGTQQVLALRGWQLEHGQLPDSLDQLVPSWFAQLPLDPMTLQPFDYYPQGQDTPLEIRNYCGCQSYGLQLPPHTPYLTSQDPTRSDKRYPIVFPVEDLAALRKAESKDNSDTQ